MAVSHVLSHIITRFARVFSPSGLQILPFPCTHLQLAEEVGSQVAQMHVVSLLGLAGRQLLGASVCLGQSRREAYQGDPLFGEDFES